MKKLTLFAALGVVFGVLFYATPVAVPTPIVSQPMAVKATQVATDTRRLAPKPLPRKVEKTAPISVEEVAPTSQPALPTNALNCSLDGGALRCGQCTTSADCPPNHGCVVNWSKREMECVIDECEDDQGCFPGYGCRNANLPSNGRVIKRCSPLGPRIKGDYCDVLFITEERACSEGLYCKNGLCAPLGDETKSDCRDTGCPDKQTCKQWGTNDPEYVCMDTVIGTCPETPCPDGFNCNMRGRDGYVVAWCSKKCDAAGLTDESCLPGDVCGMANPTTSACFKQCDVTKPDSCAKDWHCSTINEELTLWGCIPDLP